MTDVVRVLGVPELIARFVKAAVVGEVASVAAVDTLATDVKVTAQTLAPVDTGRLRDSITSDAGRVYTDVEYAPFVEYGTSDTPAQPFLRPAADTVNGSHAEEVALGVLKAI